MPSGGIGFDQMADLINGTYQRIEKLSILQIAQTYNDYVFINRLFDPKKTIVKSGRSIARNMITQRERAAYHTQPFGNDSIEWQDVTARQEVPWRRTTRPMIFDEYEDILNSGPDELFDTMKVKEINNALDLCELIEEDIHTKPADSTDTTTPWGIPMYLVENATDGFNGGNPAGFTTVAGINRSTAGNEYHKNYTFTWAGYNFEDDGVVEKLIKACDYTKFKAPRIASLDGKGVGEPQGMDRMFLCNRTPFVELRRLLRAQNDDLGKDLDPFADGAVLRQNPIVWVQQMDTGRAAVSHDTIRMVDWKWLYPVVTKGVFFRRHEAKPHPTKHNAMVVWTDLQWNLWGENFRRMAVGYKAA